MSAAMRLTTSLLTTIFLLLIPLHVFGKTTSSEMTTIQLETLQKAESQKLLYLWCDCNHLQVINGVHLPEVFANATENFKMDNCANFVNSAVGENLFGQPIKEGDERYVKSSLLDELIDCGHGKWGNLDQSKLATTPSTIDINLPITSSTMPLNDKDSTNQVHLWTVLAVCILLLPLIAICIYLLCTRKQAGPTTLPTVNGTTDVETKDI